MLVYIYLITIFSNSFSFLKLSIASKMFNQAYTELKVNKETNKKSLEHNIWPQLSIAKHSIETK